MLAAMMGKYMHTRFSVAAQCSPDELHHRASEAHAPPNANSFALYQVHTHTAGLKSMQDIKA